ncbi:MAG: hydrogen peroxide-inducible genes activator [Betaproteobacteria bacterium]|nr:MAG: hydrogen peroxide-inducible genes activator [Betaproteobacteria bacterium]
MTLQELRYIVALADTGSFQRAAVQCHISQPTLSQQVKKLEEYLGAALFDRSLRRIAPTPVGERVVASARLVIEESNRIRMIAREGADPMARTLRLGVIPTVGPYLLPRILGAIHRAHPGLRLLLREEFTDALLAKLESGALDAALIALPPEREGLRAEPLFDESFYAALPREHALARGKQVELREFSQQSVLLLEEGHCMREQALDICGRKTAYNDEIKATGLETLRQMVGLGVGCTLLPALAVDAASVRVRGNAVAIRPFRNPAPRRRIGLVWRQRSSAERTLLTLAATMRANLPAGVAPAH